MATSDPRMAGVLPPSATSLKPGNAAIQPGNLQPGAEGGGQPGLPQLSGPEAAPGGAAAPMDAIGPVIQQLIAAITQSTGKPPTPQMLQAALMSLVGGQGAQMGGPMMPAPPAMGG